MDRNQELIEIARELKALSARLDALLDSEPAATEETEQNIKPAEPAEPAKPKLTFALNDRFRFQRELFGNSAAAFAGAVEELAAMESIADVEAWFAQSGIDSTAEVGREFFNAIAAQK